jgi:flagellar motor switch protein FliM
MKMSRGVHGQIKLASKIIDYSQMLSDMLSNYLRDAIEIQLHACTYTVRQVRRLSLHKKVAKLKILTIRNRLQQTITG